MALYVHIPFCETKCPYCDFNTYAGIESAMPAYVDALTREIKGWGAMLGKPALSSVFFGGGTPSYLPTRDLTRLSRAIAASFSVVANAEYTLEANPGDLSRERLRAFRRAGFNRLSIGVQSFDDVELGLLGRRHSAEQARLGYLAARQAGFDNVNLDLIFGLPYQFLSTWEHTVEEAIELAPDHVSAYALTLEEGTPMEADVRSGRLPEPDPDLAAEMYLLIQRRLTDAGYRQYEISNWAREGHASRHNLAYWESRPYLGVGPGAHSYLYSQGGDGHSLGMDGNLGGGHALEWAGNDGVRFANMRPPRGYIERTKAWDAAPTMGPTLELLRSVSTIEMVEVLSPATAMGDAMMMGLRLNDGVSDAAFVERFGRTIAEAFPRALAECLDLGLVGWQGGRLQLTENGRLLGNEAFQRFVAEGS